MSDEAFVNAAMTRLIDAGAIALQAGGNDAVEGIRDSVSVPVEYFGGKTIRSSPGEAPRKETGVLWDGIQSNVDRQGDELTLTVETKAPYSRRLEETRPFMGPAFDRLAQELPDRVAEVMARELST